MNSLWPLFRIYYGPKLIADCFVTGVRSEPLTSIRSNLARPEQTAFIERFNRTYRTEVLNA